MRYRPGRGTAALLGIGFAVAVTMAVLATFFLFPGGPCAGDECTELGDPTVIAISEISPTPDGSAPAEPPSAAPSTGPQLPPSRPVGSPGQGDLEYDTQVQMPPTSAAPTGPDPDGVSATIMAGPLRVVSPAPQAPTGGFLKVDRMTGTARGRLEPVVVQDFRGSTAGWALTATMSDFEDGGTGKLSADQLAWEPKCVSHPGPTEPYPSTAVPGPPVSSGRTALLCSAPPSHGVTGGQFDVGADIRLQVPLVPADTAGRYSATLLLTLV
jgi:hypothetical protein